MTKLFLTLALLFVCPAFVAAQDDDHDHDHDHGLHFSHPLIVESPSPDKKVRIDYFYLRGEEDGEKFTEHTPRLEAEYAFRRFFSIEVNLPYTVHRPEGMPGQSHADNVEVSLKFASFKFDEKGLLPTYGVSFELPAGNGTGIGSDHIVTVEPFAGLGYKRRNLELIGITSFGFPANTRAGDDEGKEFAFGFASLYKVTPHIQPLLEWDGHHILSGPNRGETVVNVSPGIKLLPDEHHWQIGIGAGFPLTHAKEFKVRAIFSVFYHF